MSNVKAMPGLRVPGDVKPNEGLVSMLEDLLGRAKTGSLRSLIASGFTADGLRVAVWADHHDNVHEMLGALAWLQAEYVHRHTHTDG